ncbi:MAG TPA: serine/threonine protein phosphatase, partial [Peptococcaceae bacterium]|nr:serine/threonine protein phosphatase [Peptococcaceae bacterium]
MRLLYLTDTHLRANTPANRRDNLVETLRAKLAEVVALAEEHAVSAVLHGGDLFESPNPGLATAGELLRGFLTRLARRGIPFYITPGNHEMFGHNPATLQRTLLGFMGQIGVVRLLDRTAQ